MPNVFCNNLQAARAVFCMTAVAGLQASKFWKGQGGFGVGFPFLWVWSREHHTGKSQAQLLANAATGQYVAGLWSGDCSKASLYERFSMQSDLTVSMDDLVLDKGGDSKPLAQVGRGLYDRTTRVVINKSRRPHCSTVFSVSTPCTLTHFPSPPSLPGDSTIGPNQASLYHGSPHSSNQSACDAR